MMFQLWGIFFEKPDSLEEVLTNIKITFASLFMVMFWIFPLSFGLAYGIAWIGVLGFWGMVYCIARFVVGLARS